MSDNDFIEVYDDAIDRATCAALIRQFDASDAVVRGRTGGGVNTDVKNSWDITISAKPASVVVRARPLAKVKAALPSVGCELINAVVALSQPRTGLH